MSHSRHRSVLNFLVNLLAGLIALNKHLTNPEKSAIMGSGLKKGL